MKKLIKLLSLATAIFALVACSQGKEPKEGGKEAKVGILQYTEHEALTLARQGFLRALDEAGYKEGDNLKLDYKNAQADQANLQSMGQQLKGNQDLVLTIATPAAQTMANIDRQTPIFFTAVTDAVSAGLIQSEDKVDANVTGTSDLVDIDSLIKLLISIKPDSKTVGILYNSSEPNSKVQVDAASRAIKAAGLKVETLTVSSTNDVQQAANQLASKVDLMYLPADNTIASTIATIGEILKEKKIPSVAGDESLSVGTLATYGVDYEELGHQTGLMAVKLLKGEAKLEELPVEHLKELKLVVNRDIAEAIGIDPATIQAPE